MISPLASKHATPPGGKPTKPHVKAGPKVQFTGTETGSLKRITLPKIGDYLKHFDFREVGASPVNQIQLVYAACIVWRLLAANERRKASPTKSWNEIRESALRDSVGYAFWFFGTPTLQRLYLATVPKEYKKALIQENPGTAAKPPANGWQHIKETIRKWNPITGYAIPTSEQVKDLKAQALHDLKKLDIPASHENFQKVDNYYKKLLTHRNMATGIGLLSTIGLLGIGINYLNFYLTRKNMERRAKELQKPDFPTAPALPKFHLPPPRQVTQANPAVIPPNPALNPIIARPSISASSWTPSAPTTSVTA